MLGHSIVKSTEGIYIIHEAAFYVAFMCFAAYVCTLRVFISSIALYNYIHCFQKSREGNFDKLENISWVVFYISQGIDAFKFRRNISHENVTAVELRDMPIYVLNYAGIMSMRVSCVCISMFACLPSAFNQEPLKPQTKCALWNSMDVNDNNITASPSKEVINTERWGNFVCILELLSR